MIAEGLRERGKTLDQMWPTPTNQEAGKGKFLETLTTKEGEPAKQGERAYNPKTGKHVQVTLDRAAQMWPTPTVGCVEGGEQSNRVERTAKGAYILRKKNKPENTFGAKLSDAVLFEEKQKMWPTPKARDYRGAEGKRVIETSTGYSKIRKESKVKYGASLNDVAEHLEMKKQKMWPTPRSSGQENLDTLIKRKGEKAAVQHNLTAAVQKWPTPTARDWKDSGKAVVNSNRKSILPVRVATDNKEAWVKGGGALNPTWVEWLMGYPEEYTVLKDWAILSSRKSSKK